MNWLPKLFNLSIPSIVAIGSLLSLFIMPMQAYAAGCPGGQWPITGGGCCPAAQAVEDSTGHVTCGSGTSCANATATNAEKCLFTTYINPAVDMLSAAVGIIVTIGIVRGALMYTQSAGDPGKATEARKHIYAALIGLFAYVTLYMLLQFIIPGGILNG